VTNCDWLYHTTTLTDRSISNELPDPSSDSTGSITRNSAIKAWRQATPQVRWLFHTFSHTFLWSINTDLSVGALTCFCRFSLLHRQQLRPHRSALCHTWSSYVRASWPCYHNLVPEQYNMVFKYWKVEEFNAQFGIGEASIQCKSFRYLMRDFN